MRQKSLFYAACAAVNIGYAPALQSVAPATTVIGGLANQYVYTTPYDFSAESNPVSLVGFVWFNGGFIASPRNVTTLDIVAPVGGVINFNNSSRGFALRRDLFLGRSVTWKNNGVLNGNGFSVFFSNSLSYTSVLQIVGDTTLDGGRNAITLSAGGALSVASDVTLTLRNLTLVMGVGSALTLAPRARIIFDNVTVIWQQNYAFTQGSLVIKGRCRFISANPQTVVFSSPETITVSAYSLLRISQFTTLRHACPTNPNSFVFADGTAVLSLDGGALVSAATSLNLTGGKLRVKRSGGRVSATHPAYKINIRSDVSRPFAIDQNPSVLRGSFARGIEHAEWI